jgi:hypothetical protein
MSNVLSFDDIIKTAHEAFQEGVGMWNLMSTLNPFIVGTKQECYKIIYPNTTLDSVRQWVRADGCVSISNSEREWGNINFKIDTQSSFSTIVMSWDWDSTR